ncbi:MAG TPA: hypothetical protein H9903_10360 [Candidatus Aquabacterium excrementipullorum]|nr:hypothetical protein [Candidatus Aquabacterium excrementipullorum]
MVMKIAKYWEKAEGNALNREGVMHRATCWGGSADSPEAAHQRARAKLRHWARLVQEQPDPFDTYGYDTGEIREELVEEITGSGGTVIGAITRNGYGALVLNTPRLLIADVDAHPAGLVDRLKARFASGSTPKTRRLAEIQAFHAHHPELGLTVFETHAGLRVFLTNQAHHPDAHTARQLMIALGTDPLYQRLCQSQHCYRARLSPKPWRCGTTRPPNRYPRELGEASQTYTHWLAAYSHHSAGYAVCRPMLTLGPTAQDEDTARLMTLHQAMTVRPGELPLA